MSDIIKLKVTENEEKIKLKPDTVEEVIKIIEVPIPSEDVDKLINRTLTTLTTDVSIIGDYALAYCAKLTEITGENVETINQSAFYNCTKLTSIYFPKLKTIRSYAFRYCPLIKEITFPLVETIGSDNFSNSVIEIFNVPNLISIDSSNFTRSKLRIINAPKLQRLAYGVFQECYTLEQAILPECTYLEDRVFYSCSKAKIIDLGKVTTMGEKVFNYVTCDVYIRTPTVCQMKGPTQYFKGRFLVPAELVNEYKAAENWSDWADQIFAIEEE